jgi:hypothetical protein
MHYERWKRNGHFNRDVDVIGRRRRDKRGYVRLYLPDHPLAGGHGWVFEHRAVVYAARNGQPPTRCDWCWTPMPNGWDDCHIDHIDYRPSNNAVENLVVACTACNCGRHPKADLAGWIEVVAARRVLNTHATERDAHEREIAASVAHLEHSHTSTAASRRMQRHRVLRRVEQPLPNPIRHDRKANRPAHYDPKET